MQVDNNKYFDKKVLIKYALLLGSNLGDKDKNLNYACNEISKLQIKIISKSSIYQTPAWGMQGDDFYNQALLIATHLKPLDLLLECLIIEQKLGRVRNLQTTGYQSRTLDIDLLHADQFVCNYEILTLPHPRLQMRNFALAPLKEIHPDWVHPIWQKSASELLDICPDDSQLVRLDD